MTALGLEEALNPSHRKLVKHGIVLWLLARDSHGTSVLDVKSVPALQNLVPLLFIPVLLGFFPFVLDS